MKKSLFQQLVLYEYRYLIGYVFLFALTAYAMFWRLGTLVPGLNEIEIEQATFSNNLSHLIDNPTDILYRLLQWVSFYVVPDPIIATRMASAIFGALSVLLIYKIIKIKFSSKIAIVCSIVFATSSWVLSYARFAHPSISTVFMITALMYVAYKAYENRDIWHFLAMALVVGLGLYHRWFIYFAILGVIVSWPILREINHHIAKKTKIIVLISMGLLIAPLVFAGVRDTSIFSTILNLPGAFPAPLTMLENLQVALAHVFWETRDFPALYLGNVPMMDIFSASMVALGLYHLDYEISKTLSRYVLSGFGLSFLILALNPDPFAISILIPFTYILLAAGFIMIVSQWNEIFPKNPIARTIAFIPLSVLIISVVAYHNERYFIAWPRTPEVIAQYPESIGRLNEYIQNAGKNVIVIGSEDESDTFEVVTRTYNEVQYISLESNVSIISADKALLTPIAEENLSEELREQLPPIRRTLSSSSSLESTLFYVYTNE
jgi:hypothetical protein